MMVMMMVMTMMTLLLSCYDRAVRRQNLLNDNSTTLSRNPCSEVKRTNELANEFLNFVRVHPRTNEPTNQPTNQ